MRKASTRLPEQGTQTPSPAPDLIPAQIENQLRTHIGFGIANGGTSGPLRPRVLALLVSFHRCQPHAHASETLLSLIFT